MHVESVVHIITMRSENISYRMMAVKTPDCQARITTPPSGPADVNA